MRFIAVGERIYYEFLNLDYLTKLNKAQHDAVVHGDGPILILAGAGSGKTRVLTHRIAHLIFHHKVEPTQIFAVTFTNKAAAEMRERVVKLLERTMPQGMDWGRDLWISTFHSACVRILRSDIHHMGFDRNFTIYDDGDQLSVVKAVMKELNISDSAYSPKSMQGRINKVKNEGVDVTTYKPNFGGPYEDAFVKIFERYSEVLRQSNSLDFADLILMTVKLFQDCPQVLKAYQERFPYLLIDEYQDTNRCQYLLMKLLAGSRANICAVGDEDQSIYRWRGADISNILNFERDYSNAEVFKLEENYRSTKNIIEAASHVISNNTERRDKKLWTQNVEGEKIELVEAYDEHDEAHKVAVEIEKAVTEGEPLNEIAIFYRTNAQSRLLEDMMRAKGLNYQIYGGLKFYERLEVKDTLAYLKLISNPKDDVSFRRIINVPARGIGQVSLDRYTKEARELGIPLYQLLIDAFGQAPKVHLDLGRAQKKFFDFYSLMETLRAAQASLLPSDLINMVLEESGYRRSLLDEATVEAQSRLENLAELRQSVVEYELRQSGEDPNKNLTLEGFLEEIALVSSADKADPDAPALKMMTIHMAKGLEFDRVLIVGMEEELFPNVRPWEAEEPQDIEEERRLFYVGMTRARKRLFLFHAKNRTVFGNSGFRVMSRFVEEIPQEYLVAKKADYFSRRRHYLDKPGLPFESKKKWDDGFEADIQQANEIHDQSSDDYAHETYEDFEEEASFKPGMKVEHPTFGRGVVRQSVGKDKLIVEFAGRGLKKISLKFSNLKTLSMAFAFLVLFFGGTPLFAKAPCIPEKETCHHLWRYTENSTQELFYSHDLNQADTEIERAVITLHGVLRNASEYYAWMLGAAKLAGVENRTLIIAPHFKTKSDEKNPTELYWTSGGWKFGDDSMNSDVSSFSVIDRLVETLLTRSAFPKLKELVLVGHSAGGQFVSRYAVTGRLNPKLPVRFVISNPSSYLYPTSERPTDTPNVFETPESTGCKDFDSYPYGMKERNAYSAKALDSELIEKFILRNITLLLGEADTENENLDMSCEAGFQGKNRWERGNAYSRYVRKVFPTSKMGVVSVPGIGHDSEKMYQSTQGLKLFFGALHGQ